MKQFFGMLVSLAIVGSAVPAWAQPSDGRQVEEEPTGGVRLPAIGLAGDHDATSVSLNPAGLFFLGGPELGLALDVADEDDARTAGPGFGLFYGQTMGGGLLPRVGVGLGLEVLRASRVRLDPDPGTPTRFTFASAMPLGNTLSFGLGWHRFFDADGMSLSGVSTWDAGLSARFGSHVASGFVVRDLGAPSVAGEPVQRRYELEVVARPTGTDRLDLGLGGRIGEEHGDADAWLRWSLKLTRGLYLRGEAETRALRLVDRDPTGVVTRRDDREYQLTAGLEVSFGGMGVGTYGSAIVDSDGGGRFGSGTLVARLSARPIPSILPARKRIEKLELSGGMSARRHTLTIAKLRRMRRDGALVAVLVQMDGLSVGWATARELRNELVALRKAGKKVFAYMVNGTSRDYYVASAADRVWIDPAGDIRFSGFSATILYFKGVFDKLGVKAEFERIEEYKSAPEAFTRTGPTEPARRMRAALYDSLLDTMVADIAASRGLDAAAVLRLMDDGPYTAGDLQGSPLVDKIATPKELGAILVEELGGRYPVGAEPRERADRWSYPKVAVIHVEGDIVDGKSQTMPIIGRRSAGSETVIGAIAAARADPSVKAIILRIDSPGGSATASELMAREVFATRGVKPIICSMGDVAASGGYFLAAGCDTILADPMTITGSIGIFFGKFDVSGLASRLGLSWTTWKRGQRADIASMWRPLSDEERVFFKERLRYFYNRFVKTVADGRKMTEAEVDEVGRGRVWTGAAAKGKRLVDQHGGIGDAIELAKARVGLGDDELVQLVLLPQQEVGLLQQLTGLPTGQAAAPASPLELIPGGAALLRALPLSLLVQPSAPQARLPFELHFD